MDWAAVSIISGVVVVGFGYLSAQLNRVGDRLTRRIDDVETRLGAKVDHLTERYISHLEHHPR